MVFFFLGSIPRDFLAPLPNNGQQTQIPTSSSLPAQRSLTPPKGGMGSPPMMVHPSPYHPHHPGHHMPPHAAAGWHHAYGPMQHSPMNVHSPLSPYGGYDTASMASSGYYSSGASTPKSAGLYRDYYHHHHSPSPRSSLSSSHSPNSVSYSSEHGSNLDLCSPAPQVVPAAPVPAPPLTQDPTPSSTFQEEDEDILNSIIQWEKY